jgi:hypothetical protein
MTERVRRVARPSSTLRVPCISFTHSGQPAFLAAATSATGGDAARVSLKTQVALSAPR